MTTLTLGSNFSCFVRLTVQFFHSLEFSSVINSLLKGTPDSVIDGIKIRIKSTCLSNTKFQVSVFNRSQHFKMGHMTQATPQ